jgi:hypothetical protein
MVLSQLPADMGVEAIIPQVVLGGEALGRFRA